MDSHPSLMVLMSVLFYTSILVFYTYVDVCFLQFVLCCCCQQVCLGSGHGSETLNRR